MMQIITSTTHLLLKFDTLVNIYLVHMCILTAIMSAPQTIVSVDCQTVKTNIVFLTVTKPGLTATQLYDRLLQVH